MINAGRPESKQKQAAAQAPDPVSINCNKKGSGIVPPPFDSSIISLILFPGVTSYIFFRPSAILKTYLDFHLLNVSRTAPASRGYGIPCWMLFHTAV